MNNVVQRAFRDYKNLTTVQLFFVNAVGTPLFENAVFMVAPLVDQFKCQVDQSIKKLISSKAIHLSK